MAHLSLEGKPAFAVSPASHRACNAITPKLTAGACMTALRAQEIRQEELSVYGGRRCRRCPQAVPLQGQHGDGGVGGAP